MDKIKISHTDLEVSPINFGGNVFGWTIDEKESFEILDAFYDTGYNFIDTSDIYSWWVNGTGGQSERIIGNWLKSRGNRENMVIATKVGGETKEHPIDTSRKHILKTVDESLKRLQIDCIDLYYTHFDDEKTPIEETLSAYDEIIRAGKVRYIAASNISPSRLTESFDSAEKNSLPRYVALQPHYNLMERRNYEENYHPLAEKYDLTVFPYFSLASGFLSGKYRSEEDLGKSVRGGGLKKYLNGTGFAVLDALDKTAERHGTQPAAIALAWLLSRPHIGAPIVSATKISQLSTLFEVPKIRLDKEELDLLDKASQ